MVVESETRSAPMPCFKRSGQTPRCAGTIVAVEEHVSQRQSDETGVQFDGQWFLNFVFSLDRKFESPAHLRRLSTGCVLSRGQRGLMFFLSRQSIIWWSLKTYGKNQRKYATLRADDHYSHLKWLEIAVPWQANEILRELARLMPNPPLEAMTTAATRPVRL